jgi:hypothetical protein
VIEPIYAAQNVMIMMIHPLSRVVACVLPPLPSFRTENRSSIPLGSTARLGANGVVWWLILTRSETQALVSALERDNSRLRSQLQRNRTQPDHFTA